MGGAELLEETGDGVVPLVEGACGHEAAVLGVEDEDKAEQGGDEAAVEFLRVAGPDGAKERAGGFLIGGLEAAGEFVEGFEDLAGKIGADMGLVFPAFAEQGGQADAFLDDVEALLGKEEVERPDGEAACGAGEEGDGKGDPAGVLALRHGDEAQGVAIAKEAEGNAALAQEALELLVRRGVPTARAGLAGQLVERGAGGEVLDEEHPGFCGDAWA
jgi:hypothetical protein